MLLLCSFRLVVAFGLPLLLSSPEKVSAWPCTMPLACIGTGDDRNASLAAEDWANASCSAGHSGLLCAVCEPGYRRTVRGCLACNPEDPSDVEAAKSAGVTRVAVVILLVLLISGTLSVLHMQSGLRTIEVADESFQGAPRLLYTNAQYVFVLLGRLPWESVGTLFKILLGYGQCMSLFTRLDYVRWPGDFLSFLRGLELASMVDIIELTHTDCVTAKPLGFSFEVCAAFLAAARSAGLQTLCDPSHGVQSGSSRHLWTLSIYSKTTHANAHARARAFSFAPPPTPPTACGVDCRGSSTRPLPASQCLPSTSRSSRSSPLSCGSQRQDDASRSRG